MTQKVCVKCQIELRCKKNGIGAITMNQHGTELEVWDADLWFCPACGLEVVLGFGSHPISEHFKHDFARVIANYATQVRFWLNRREQDIARSGKGAA